MPAEGTLASKEEGFAGEEKDREAMGSAQPAGRRGSGVLVHGCFSTQELSPPREPWRHAGADSVGLGRVATFPLAPVLGQQPPPPTHVREQGSKEWYSEMAQTPDPLLALKITLHTMSLPGQAGGTDRRHRCARFGFKVLWPRACEMPIQETYKSMLQKC